MTRNGIVALGIAAVIAETAIFHGVFGTGGRFATRIERTARADLNALEMHAVSARMQRSPLRRQLVLSGPADDFQRQELVRIMGQIPGVADVRWTSATPSPSGAK